MEEATDGQRVEVQIYGNDEWYPGTVFKNHQTWIRLDICTYGIGHIVGAESVREWREAAPLHPGDAERRDIILRAVNYKLPRVKGGKA